MLKSKPEALLGLTNPFPLINYSVFILRVLPLLRGRALAPAPAFAPSSAASLAPAPALPVRGAFAPALALTPALACALLLLLLSLMLPLMLLLLLLLLLLSLLLCSEGIWSLETLHPDSEQVLKGRDDFGRIRPNVFSLLGGV